MSELNFSIFLVFTLCLFSKLTVQFRKFFNTNTESSNCNETFFQLLIDHSSLLFKNFNDCNNLNELGLKTKCSENSDSLWIRGYKVFNSNSEVSFFSSLGMKIDYSLLNNINESSIMDNQSLTSFSVGISYNLSKNLSISAESSANNNFSNFLMFSNNPLLDYKKINHSIG